MTIPKANLILVALSCGLCWLLIGCQSGTPSSGGPQPISLSKQSESGSSAGATCTIALHNLSGTGAETLAQAKSMLVDIQQQTSWKDLHIIQSDMFTKICRGYFMSFSSSEAQRTLHQVRNFTDSRGNKPFETAIFAALPNTELAPASGGPPEWDLRRSPANASLCIGFFVNDELCKDRVAAAVEKVKKLRNKGVEAWYYHGQYRSGVYVGHFDAQYEWVTTGKSSDGQLIHRMQFVTHDPSFATLRKQFPEYQRNGEIQLFNYGGREAYDPSRLVPVPRPGQEVSDSEAGL